MLSRCVLLDATPAANLYCSCSGDTCLRSCYVCTLCGVSSSLFLHRSDRVVRIVDRGSATFFQNLNYEFIGLGLGKLMGDQFQIHCIDLNC